MALIKNIYTDAKFGFSAGQTFLCKLLSILILILLKQRRTFCTENMRTNTKRGPHGSMVCLYSEMVIF